MVELNQKFNEVKYQPDDIIFNIGSDSEVFYILKTGRLIVETIIEIEDYHKFPVVIILTFSVHYLILGHSIMGNFKNGPQTPIQAY